MTILEPLDGYGPWLAQALTDDLGVLAGRAMAAPGLWEATPHWNADASLQMLADSLVAWTDAALIVLDKVGSALAQQLDGNVTLGDLASDLAAVVDCPLEFAQVLTARTAVRLSSIGAIDGLVLPPPLVDGDFEQFARGEPDLAPHIVSTPTESTQTPIEPTQRTLDEYEVIDPVSGSSVRTVISQNANGQRLVTQHFPDGRRVITAHVVITGSSPEAAMEIAGALTGDRTPAELVPIDSCLGSKLRNQPEVSLTSFLCDDGSIRSVRCHDERVAQALQELAGDRLVSDARGPIEVFVTTPYEGDGPLRIYDGRGTRRGRPRTVDDAVRVVDQIVGERTASQRPISRNTSVQLPRILVQRSEQALLVPSSAVANGRDVRHLIEAGWVPSVGYAEVHPDGSISAPSAFATPRRYSPDQVVLIHPTASECSQGSLLLDLVAREVGHREERSVVLARLADFTERVRVVDFDDVWPALTR